MTSPPFGEAAPDAGSGAVVTGGRTLVTGARCGGLVGLALLCTLLAPQSGFGRSADSAPPLPAPSGTIVTVSSEPALQEAVRTLQSNTTILVTPGTYVLSRTLWITGRVQHVSLRGASGNRDDVVLVGGGMRHASYGLVPYGIWTGGQVDDIEIANLTIRDIYSRTLVFAAGAEHPHVYNVRLVDSGEQFLEARRDEGGGAVNDGVVEYSTFEYSGTGRDVATNGVDVHGGAHWVIRHNLFRNIVGPSGQLAGPAVLAWDGARETLTEGNTFLNCSRGIAYGLVDRGGSDHHGGLIRNNMVFRAPGVSGGPGILVADSAQTQVLNNTVFLSHTYGTPVEYQFPGAHAVVVANNLLDGVVWARDGATGIEAANVTDATPEMFVDVHAGDLHLTARAGTAIDRGITVPTVLDDWDGQARPAGRAYDVGAHEYGAERTATSIARGPARRTGATVVSTPPAAAATIPAPPPTAQPSANGTTVPPSASLVDADLNLWTRGPVNASGFYEVDRNGVGMLIFHSSSLLWWNGSVYAHGADGNWWLFANDNWTNTGPVSPSAALPPPVSSAPPPPPSTPPPSGTPTGWPLVQASSLAYQGAFRLPADYPGPCSATNGDLTGFEYGGTALSFNAGNQSLFVVGHAWCQLSAEVTIPTPVISADLTDLPFADVLQGFADVTSGTLSKIGGSNDQIGGQLVYGGKLYATGFIYYDGTGSQVLSHFVKASTNLGVNDVQGPFALTANPGEKSPSVGAAGFVDGYMGLIPNAWQPLLGGPALTGQGVLPIISRTSSGPAAYVFDPTRVGAVAPVSATPLVVYPIDHPLAPEGAGPNPYFQQADELGGVVFPDGTRSVLFFGRHGLGAYCYGPGTSDPNLAGTPATAAGDNVDNWCYDPEGTPKGVHAYPYAYYVWAYDANDLAAVRQGTRQPWSVLPYAVWPLTFPITPAAHFLLGAAYDRASGRIYVTQGFADGDVPLVHVFSLTTP